MFINANDVGQFSFRDLGYFLWLHGSVVETATSAVDFTNSKLFGINFFVSRI